jgi:hypothetical protein
VREWLQDIRHHHAVLAGIIKVHDTPLPRYQSWLILLPALLSGLVVCTIYEHAVRPPVYSTGASRAARVLWTASEYAGVGSDTGTRDRGR